MFEFDKAIRGIASAGGIMLISGVAANSVVAVPDGRAPFAQVADSTPPPQLIANFERLLRSTTGQRVAASDDVQAQRLLADARAQLAAAQAALAAGDVTAARAAAPPTRSRGWCARPNSMPPAVITSTPTSCWQRRNAKSPAPSAA